jgi:hypothetical protein
MGKGKKSTMKNESKMDEPADASGGASRNNKKVSSEDVTNTNDTDAPLNSTGSPTTDSTVEVWDVLRVIEDPNDTCCCRMEECKSKAVVVWATNLDPTDEWPMCEECQQKVFRRWPTNITPPKHSKEAADDDEPDDEPDEVATEEKAQARPAADETCNDDEQDPSKVTESNDNNDADINRDGGAADANQGAEMEEAWDVKKVMSIADVSDCPIKCSTETCTLAAACVYVSNLAPTEKWYTCLDCQVSNRRRENTMDLSSLILLVCLLTSISFNIIGKRLRWMARTQRTSHRCNDARTQRCFDLQVLSQEGPSHAEVCGGREDRRDGPSYTYCRRNVHGQKARSQ